jgi:hypothetical protein
VLLVRLRIARFWQLAFPIPYRASLEKFARQAEIDPFVFAGSIRQESEFNATVVSASNAYGLSQILPSTGRDLSRRVGLPRFSPRMLFDPATNIQLGTDYIRHLLNSLEGNWHEALAAYNGGRTRVIKWRTFAQYREPAEFIETIPFDETRGYVQSVLRNAAVYRQLYDGKAAAIVYPDLPPAPVPVAAVGKPPARKAGRPSPLPPLRPGKWDKPGAHRLQFPRRRYTFPRNPTLPTRPNGARFSPLESKD